MLKIIAAITMTIDHIGAILFPHILILRIIGRIAFPIFAFMIAEGCKYTKNKLRYLLFMMIAAFIFQVVYYAFTNDNYMNIFVTFSLSIIMIYALQFFKVTLFNDIYKISQKILAGFMFLLSIAFTYLINDFVEIHYGIFGCILPVFVALFHKVNGNNPKAKKAIDNKIKKAKLKHIVINLGFTNKISDYFKACDIVLGKAGGLTTTETINAELPSLIINKLPQQEIYNRDYLVNNNCALSVNKNTIAQKINYLIENKDEYKKLKSSIKKVKIDNSLNIFYNTFKTFPTANYSNIVFTDNKKQVIKNVSAALKNEIVN